jgi:hypothetical protein
VLFIYWLKFSAKYLGGPGFKSKQGDLLSWLKFLIFFSSVPSDKSWDYNRSLFVILNLLFIIILQFVAT